MSRELLIATFFAAGLCFGSFANVLILRSRSGESLWLRSRCPNCHKEIRWYDLVPVLSFLALGGRCRYCGEGISWQYPLVELLCAGLFGSSAAIAGTDYYLGVYLSGLAFWAVVIGVGDCLFWEIDDRHLLGLLIWTLPFLWQRGDLTAAGLGAATGFLIAAAISAVGYIRYRIMAFGGGDVLLCCVAGLVIGWPNVMSVLMLAVGLHAMTGMLLVLTRFFRRCGSIGALLASCVIPFAPAVVVASFIVAGLRLILGVSLDV